jgi:hypothetical protein
MTLTDYELIQIENAFEDASGLIEEQDLSLTEAIEEAAFIHDLDENQIKALRRMLINLS